MPRNQRNVIIESTHHSLIYSQGLYIMQCRVPDIDKTAS